MFSPNEQRVIDTLGKRKVKVKELAMELYDISKMPNASNIIISAVTRINKKCNEDPKIKWIIRYSGLGRSGKTIWRDKK